MGSGHSFSLLGVQTARKGLSGLEFASGIPASVGGAIFMNAGATGRETCESLHSVLYLHENGTQVDYQREELIFSYRTSPFQTMKGVILAARFLLRPSLTARQSQLKIIETRIRTQPYKDKSIGCIFRNPSKEITAGALIDRCGLKGTLFGGAQVSQTHANFIVNKGAATSHDVLALIQHIQRHVFEQTGIHLEPEVRLVELR